MDEQRKKEKGNQGLEQYAQGNLYHREKNRALALQSWKKAKFLWKEKQTIPVKASWERAQKMAPIFGVVLAFFFSFAALFFFFPRSFEEVNFAAGNPEGSFWERFFQTSRRNPELGHKLSVEELWQSMKESFGKKEPVAQENLNPSGLGIPLKQRWSELVDIYGQYRADNSLRLNYQIIAGSNLNILDNYEEAVAVLEKGLSGVEDRMDAADLYQTLANTHYNKGYRHQKDGTATYQLDMVKKAVDAYEESLTYQERGVSYGNLGWMYFLLKDYPKSEQYSKKALEIHPSLHYVEMNLGLLYLVQGKERESFFSYYKMLKANPHPRDFLGGITDLREILRDNPGRYPFAHFVVGMLSLQGGDLSQAKSSLGAYLQKASASSPWRSLALVMLEQMQASGDLKP